MTSSSKSPVKSTDQLSNQSPTKSSINRPLNSYFASCSKGLEEVLETELKGFGIIKTLPTQGGVHFKASLEQVFATLLNTRIASRVFKHLFKFSIKKENDLYHKGLDIHWDKVFRVDQTFKIKTVLSSNTAARKRSRFKNSLFLTYKLKDAIVDKFQTREKKRPSINTKDADISFLMHIEPDKRKDFENVSLLVDLSGFPLFKRNYRTQNFPAPLKETLAAGLIKLSDWNPDLPLVDLMSGSGTFITEAMMSAAKVPATYLSLKYQSWSLVKQQWFQHDESAQKLWDQAINKVLDFDLKEHVFNIYASDLNPKARRVTTSHVEELSPLKIQPIHTQDALEVMPPTQTPGMLIMNPPYGDRLGNKDQLHLFYKQLGDHLKQNWKGWTAYLLIGDLELIKYVGLRSTKKHIVFNGPIECRFVKYELF